VRGAGHAERHSRARYTILALWVGAGGEELDLVVRDMVEAEVGTFLVRTFWKMGVSREGGEVGGEMAGKMMQEYMNVKEDWWVCVFGRG